jgi:hypothetical protein
MSLDEAALDQPQPQLAPAVAAEFEAMTRRLGIEVPPHLLRGVLLGHQGLTGLAALLRNAELPQAQPSVAEPPEVPGA